MCLANEERTRKKEASVRRKKKKEIRAKKKNC